MNIITFLIIGALAGWLAGKIMSGGGFGLLGNLVIGIVGALVGGFTFDVLNIHAGGFIGNLVMATIGAVILLFVIGLVAARR